MADKFLFDTQFEPPKVKAKALPPRFEQADLERARADGMSEGRRAALAEAKASHEAAIGALLDKLAEGVRQLLTDRRESALTADRHSLEVAHAALSKLFPRLNREHGLAEIEAVIEACLVRLREEPRLVVRVSDGTLDTLKARLDAMAEHAGFAGKIVMIAEDRLKAGDVVIEWADGGAERNQGQLWLTVEEVVRRGLGPRASDGPATPAQGMSAIADGAASEPLSGSSNNPPEPKPIDGTSARSARGN